jgi:pimeloyl-ACP methyl ester carboxylesterase
MKKICLYLILLASALANAAGNPLYIVIHGTWSSDKDWHLPGGDFFDELVKSSLKHNFNASVISYNWSGKLSHLSRMQAAKGLARLIQSYPLDTPIHVVSHSHGGNVALLASQILGRDRYNKHKIQTLYSLATPIDMEEYYPDMDIITYVYNFFSRADNVQPVFGAFGREFTPHKRIANLRITIEGKEPGHSDLHHIVIARWLPFIPDYFVKHSINSFQFFSFSNPGIVHFKFQGEPRYEIDLRQVALRKAASKELLKRYQSMHK